MHFGLICSKRSQIPFSPKSGEQTEPSLEILKDGSAILAWTDYLADGSYKGVSARLINNNGEYFSVASDLAIMFPMLEMAGNRQEFISEILYVYNDKNPISDHNIRRKEQILAAKEIRQKTIYRKRKFY